MRISNPSLPDGTALEWELAASYDPAHPAPSSGNMTEFCSAGRTGSSEVLLAVHAPMLGTQRVDIVSTSKRKRKEKIK
jgi:hypothetical protein